jgi:fission process protein 1
MASSKDITIQAAEDKVDQLAEQDADSVDSDIRYLAYGARLRTALRAGTRYVAYVCSLLCSLHHCSPLDRPVILERRSGL